MPISVLRDNGTEFNIIHEWCTSKGIEVTKTPPYTPQHNAKNERLHRTIRAMLQATMYSSGLPYTFEILRCIGENFIQWNINHLPTKGNPDNKPPIKLAKVNDPVINIRFAPGSPVLFPETIRAKETTIKETLGLFTSYDVKAKHPKNARGLFITYNIRAPSTCFVLKQSGQVQRRLTDPGMLKYDHSDNIRSEPPRYGLTPTAALDSQERKIMKKYLEHFNAPIPHWYPEELGTDKLTVPDELKEYDNAESGQEPLLTAPSDRDNVTEDDIALSRPEVGDPSHIDGDEGSLW